MELRRALLLFAIVLGLAAIASSIAQPPDRDDGESTPAGGTRSPSSAPAGATPSAMPQPGAPGADATTIRFPAARRRQVRKLEQGRPATLLVEVTAPAQVDVPSLGLTQPAEPLTPARFEVLVSDAGSHRIVVRPVTSSAPRPAPATLEVVPAGRPSERTRNAR